MTIPAHLISPPPLSLSSLLPFPNRYIPFNTIIIPGVMDPNEGTGYIRNVWVHPEFPDFELAYRMLIAIRTEVSTIHTHTGPFSLVIHYLQVQLGDGFRSNQ